MAPSVAEELDDGEGRRFAEIVDVAFVGEAENEDLGAVDGLRVSLSACDQSAR